MSSTRCSRTRKILGLIKGSTAPDNKNTLPTYNINEKYNYNNKDSDELQNENNYPVEMEEEAEVRGEIITESVDYFNKTKYEEVTALQNEDSTFSVEIKGDVEVEGITITEPVNYFDKTNELPIATAKSQLVNTQPKISLVPDYDSDKTTISDNEDTTIRSITAEVESQNEKHPVRRHSSSSSLSSTSSSSTSSTSTSSSSSSSSSSRPTQQANSIKPDVTVDETDIDSVVENTPPQQQYLGNTRSVFERHPRELKKAQSYYTSPVYTDESEIDLSDTDPTFTNNDSRRKRNYFFNQSSSSSTTSSNSKRAKRLGMQKGRKRTKNPAQWKQNKIKRMRNKGKSYVSISKTQKNIPARCLKEPCTDKCRFKCSTNINTESRYELFKKFWDLGDLAKQRAYISASMIDVQPRYRYTNAERPRHNNKAFHFIVDNTLIRVCKTFYKATLDISDRMIFTVQNKMKENDFSLKDLRGRHQNHRKIDPELRAAIIEHISSIPKIESHYVRASTTKEYIEGNKTIKDLYSDFKVKQQQDNKDTGTYTTYYNIFTKEFNLSFFQPKKDQCDLCNSYYNANANQKKDLEDIYQTHIEEKNCSRIEKLNDRKKVNKNMRVAVYDLEAVLQCPKGDTSSFYYKSKLNSYNLTITELTSKECKVAYKNVHCYFWSECDAKRGAIEIGSCVWAYLKALSEEDNEEKEVIFYSDNCCGQNKNKYIITLYLYAVQSLNIKTIIHKFLIRGHTQNEADSVHALIEKEIKKNLKSGPIYTPDQYIALIKSAKKSKPPLTVHEMNFESFYDLKILQEEWGYNYTTNTDGQNVNWNEIKVLKVTKENSTIFFYKSSYKDENYKEVDVRNRRKKMKPTTEIELQAAYVNKQDISENKKKDLKELISKGLIPSFYAGFYNSLF